MHVHGYKTTEGYTNVFQINLKDEWFVLPPGTYSSSVFVMLYNTHDGGFYANGIRTFTLSSPKKVTGFYAICSGVGEKDYYITPMLVAGSKIPISYIPYTGDTYTQALPETVYGGSYHWATGELVVDAQLVDGAVQKLNEPHTIQLAPQQILSIPGINTIFSNSGDTTVLFHADPIRGDRVTKDSMFNLFVSFHGGEDYRQVMAAYFQASGAETAEDLTDIVESWYKLGRNGWTGGTRFDAPDKSTASTGRKIGDNAGLVCEPSTNTVRGRDDYATLPLFAVTDCNWELDAEGKRHITAIKGITSAKPFVTNDPARPVGVLQMAPWCRYTENTNGYEYWFTDQMNKEGYYPIPESVDLDGTVHSFVVHAKYGMGDACSSIAKVPPRGWDVSYTTQLTEIPAAFGGNRRYCGKCSCDDAWMKLHVYIKYASLTLDGIMNGCCQATNTNMHPAVGETGVKRIIVTIAHGNTLLAGSTICLGTASYGNRDNQTSVVDRRKITSIEDVEINGTAYKAIYLDVSKPFDTTTELFVSSTLWYTGSTDAVLGNDGSPYSNTSGKEPYKLQGIEQSYGGTEVIADTILTYAAENGANVLTTYVCRDAAQFDTSATTAYRKAGYSLACPEKATWNYLKKLGHDALLPEIMFGCLGGGSSSTYTKDSVYQLNRNQNNHEWLTLGGLTVGVERSGLSSGHANGGITHAVWSIIGRISANGSRGEYAL